jgi:hypothetical protein
MRLKCLAGAYAGQVRDYSTVAGLAALRTGMAAALVDRPAVAARTPTRTIKAPPRSPRRKEE